VGQLGGVTLAHGFNLPFMSLLLGQLLRAAFDPVPGVEIAVCPQARGEIGIGFAQFVELLLQVGVGAAEWRWGRSSREG
jgi:hypothetical protein